MAELQIPIDPSAPLAPMTAYPPLGGRRILTVATLPDILEAALDAGGMSMVDLARRLGMKPQSLAQYKQSIRRNPSLEWIQRYLQTCGCRIVVEFPSEPL